MTAKEKLYKLAAEKGIFAPFMGREESAKDWVLAIEAGTHYISYKEDSRPPFDTYLVCLAKKVQ